MKKILFSLFILIMPIIINGAETVSNDAELAIMEMQADMFEQQEQSNLTLMESLADLYETMMGGN